MWRAIKVLLVDDDQERSHDLKVILDFVGEGTLCANSQDCGEVLSKVDDTEEVLCALIGDCTAGSGLQATIEKLTEIDQGLPILMLGTEEETQLPDEDFARSVIARVELPPSYTKLLDSLHRAQIFRDQHSENAQRGQKREVQLFRSLVGTSRKVQGVRALMSQVADKDVNVLITGESGTGKEVVARNLHYHSHRRHKPFVPVNCGAIPGELLSLIHI